MRRRVALILLALLGMPAGWGALAQLPDAPRGGNRSPESMLPDGAGRAGSPGRGEVGAAPANPGSGFTAFPDAASGQGAPGATPQRPSPGAARAPGTGGSGTGGRPATPGGAAGGSPLIGAGNFCAQPAGLCGPGCSIGCREGQIAHCTGGQGGPTSPTGTGACATPPSCRCR